MRGYLLDTNVVSDLVKGKRSNSGVKAWLKTTYEYQLFISVITLGEIEKGLTLAEHKGLDVKRQRYFFERELPLKFDGRILSLDSECAKRWGVLLAALKGDKTAERILSLDAQIAAIAQEHQLTVCTRNTSDFERLGQIEIVNPFT